MEFTFDLWTLVGLASQGCFFLRFIVQWVVSEKKKKTIIPATFWYLSLLGTALLIVYSIKRMDVVFLLAGALQTFIYSRNLLLHFKNLKTE